MAAMKTLAEDIKQDEAVLKAKRRIAKILDELEDETRIRVIASIAENPGK